MRFFKFYFQNVTSLVLSSRDVSILLHFAQHSHDRGRQFNLKDSAMNLVSVLKMKFLSQSFVSLKGIPFTHTDNPSPCYQQTEKMLPHDGME